MPCVASAGSRSPGTGWGRALRYFRANGDTYNTARALTDLAETWLDASDTAAARPLIEAAISTLSGQSAEYHVAHLPGMRERCPAEERGTG